MMRNAVVLLPLLSVWGYSQENPQFTLSLGGPCGQTILGAPGTAYDDGTGGGPDFKNNRPGHTWNVIVTTTNNPLGSTDLAPARWSWSLGVEGVFSITDITTDGTVSCNKLDPRCRRRAVSYDITELTGPPFGQDLRPMRIQTS